MGIAEWDGFRHAACCGEAARPPARARRGDVSGMDRRRSLRGARYRDRWYDDGGDDEIEIFSATQAMGQGLATTYAQLAVDTFGVAIDRKVAMSQGDTDRAQGFGSAGSRSLFSAVRRCASAAETHRRARRATRRRGAGGGGRRYRISRRGFRHRRYRSPDRPVRARAPPAASSASCSIPRAASRGPTGPTAATSAKSRSIPRPARSRSLPTGRATTSAASSIR